MDTKMIGSKISKARKETNMSQAKLAQLLFISPQAIGKWERGESMPDITTFNRLAEILNVDLNYFSENVRSVNDESASKRHVNRIGENEEAAQVVSNTSPVQERHVQIELNAMDLQKTDFTGAVLHKGKFKVSPLRGSNFAGADLTGSSFEVIDARETNFDNANLTDCSFSVTDLKNASFRKSILVRTTLDMSGQGAKFIDASLVDVKLNKTDLRDTIFENCVFNGVDFSYCDLRGLCFDGLSFISVRFDKSALNNVSFKGATLRNVSFTLPFSVTNRSYRSMKTICFDGATMDKLTYAALKGLGSDLSRVTVI